MPWRVASHKGHLFPNGQEAQEVQVSPALCLHLDNLHICCHGKAFVTCDGGVSGRKGNRSSA